MSFFDVLILGVALSMDAFAVALCKGLSIRDTITLKKCIIVGLWFGLFQGIMPLVGYVLGIRFSNIIVEYDHWIAFILLSIIGSNMVKEGLSKEEEENNDSLHYKEMFLLAVATSIDALAVGVTLAFLQVNIIFAVLVIGITTFILSTFAVKIGGIFGSRFKSKAEIFGGVTLILIGLKILFEHLNIL